MRKIFHKHLASVMQDALAVFYRHCNHFASVLCRFRKIFRTFAFAFGIKHKQPMLYQR